MIFPIKLGVNFIAFFQILYTFLFLIQFLELITGVFTFSKNALVKDFYLVAMLIVMIASLFLMSLWATYYRKDTRDAREGLIGATHIHMYR